MTNERIDYRECHIFEMMRRFILCIFILAGVQLYSQWPGSGNALEFDGQDDYISFDKSFGSMPFPFTIVMWYRPDRQGGRHRLFFSHNSTGAYRGCWLQEINGKLKFVFGELM